MTNISSLNKVDPLGRVCWLLNATELGVGPHGGQRTTATAMVNWFVRSHRCRNHPLLLLFLPVCCPRHCTSCLHDVPARMMRKNKRFGVEAAKPTAPMPTEMLFLTTLSGRHHQLPGTLPYIFLRRTQTTSKTMSVNDNTSWPKQRSTVAVVPHSRCRCKQLSHRILADWRMQRHWEWSSMAVVGWRQLAWLVGGAGFR